MKLNEVKAVITGGTSGIGLATAQSLISAGAIVGIVGRNEEKTNSIAKKIEAYPIIMDVKNEESIKQGLHKFCETAAVPNVLVNSAGILLDGPAVSFGLSGIKLYQDDKWQETIDVNLTGTFKCIQLFTELVIKNRIKNSVIINISSVSRGGNAGQSAYSASKGAIVSLTASLAKELSPLKMRVVAIAPGLTDTPMAQSVPEAYRNDIIKNQCIKRIGHPEEIAHGALFCIENEFFDGKVLELDGGLFIS